eukprot:UN06184
MNNRESAQNENAVEMNVNVESKEKEIDIALKPKQKQKQKTISLINNRENVVQKRNVNVNKENCGVDIGGSAVIVNVHSIEGGKGNDEKKNDGTKTKGKGQEQLIISMRDEDESRGLHKRRVSLRVKVSRCVTRICPNIFLRKNKKNNIDLIVDSRCKHLEKSLWCLIGVCCAMIILLTLHRYNSS